MVIRNGNMSDGEAQAAEDVLTAIEGVYDSSAVIANVDGNVLERLEDIANSVDGSLPYYLRQSEDVVVNPDIYASFFVNLLASNGVAIPIGDININDINIRLEKSASGGAYSIAGVTQPTLNKAAGQVYTAIVFQSAEGWDENSTYRLTLSSVKITIATVEYTLQTFVWNNAVTIVKTIDTEIDAITVKLSKPAVDSADNNTIAEAVGNKSDTVAGDSAIARIKQALAYLANLDVDADAIDAKLDTIAGYLDTEVAAIKVETDKIPATITKIDNIKTETDKIPATITKIDNIKTETDKIPATITKIDNIAGYLDTEITAIKTETDKIPATITKIDNIKTETDKVPATITKIDNIKTATDQVGTLVNTGGTASLSAIIGDVLNISIAARLISIASYIDTEVAAIKAETDQVGTIVNTGGTATIGAVLGDAAGTSIVARLMTIATYIDTEVAAIKTETDKISATITKIDSIKTKTDNLPADTSAILSTIAGYIDTEVAAIKTATDKIGTVTNTGGTASIGAILGDAANSSIIARLATIDSVVDSILTIVGNTANLVVRSFTVTANFIVNEVITFSTGSGATAGTSTPSGGTMTLPASGAAMLADNTCRIFLNGVLQVKQTDFVWDSTTTGHFTVPLYVGNWFSIERSIPI